MCCSRCCCASGRNLRRNFYYGAAFYSGGNNNSAMSRFRLKCGGEGANTSLTRAIRWLCRNTTNGCFTFRRARPGHATSGTLSTRNAVYNGANALASGRRKATVRNGRPVCTTCDSAARQTRRGYGLWANGRSGATAMTCKSSSF